VGEKNQLKKPLGREGVIDTQLCFIHVLPPCQQFIMDHGRRQTI